MKKTMGIIELFFDVGSGFCQNSVHQACGLMVNQHVNELLSGSCFTRGLLTISA